MEKHILLNDFLKVPDPKRTKVKFNIHAGNDVSAWDNLIVNDDCASDDEWIRMNAFRRKQPSNNLDNAEYLLAFAQYYPLGAEYYIFGGYYKVEKVYPEVLEGTGYKLTPQDEFSEYRKRLIIKLAKPIGRDIYTRWYENLPSQLNPVVYELAPSTKLADFPGYANVCLTHKDMQTIFNNEAADWKRALSFVKGVYCITDRSNGQLYIGSAYSDNEGIWQRWRSYADVNNLTGGNKTFEQMKNSGADHIINNFTYTILEIFDMRTKPEVIIQREEYWKRVFQTVAYGMNN